MDGRTLAAVILIICAMGLTHGNEYPAGLDPQSCPNYPNCDNAVLHGSRGAHGNSWNSVAARSNAWDHSWESTGHWNAPAVPGAVIGAQQSTQYPAGVNPQSCPNYPNCDNAVLHGAAFPAHSNSAGSWGSVPAAAWNTAQNGHPPTQLAPQYPAGVSAQSCPNYPYC